MKTRFSEIIESALKENRKVLLEPEAKTICLEYDIPTPEFLLASTADEATKCSEKLGYPVVMKIVSPDILHKTEAEGIAVGIQDARNVRLAFSKIIDSAKRYKSDARILGVLVEKMAPPAMELIVGAIKDSQLGQAIMFGYGGIFVEIYKDVTFRIAPITKANAQEMLKEIKAYPILKGFRGQPPADELAIVEILTNVSRLVMDCQQISQLDLNPVMAYHTGASAVDARIILAEPDLKAK
jgi:acetyl-CoA synthetase (ADP-forming)